MKLAEIIKRFRVDKGLSQRELAIIIEISHTEISRIEKGETIKPNKDTLFKISKELELDFGALLKLAGYSNKEIYDMVDLGVELGLNPIVHEIVKNKEKEFTTFSEDFNDEFFDIIKIGNKYKNDEINKIEFVKLIHACEPISLVNGGAIYPTESDGNIEIEDL